MGNLQITYNGNTLNPTPLVRFSTQFLDYNKRWGQIAQITLDGFITGVSGSGTINTLTNLFTGQFGTLTVTETNGNTIYNWTNVIIDNLTFSNSYFYSGTKAPYTVSLKSYTIPSGVVEPVNEYSFSQNDDGLVGLTHKVAAKGVRNSNSSLNNAITFVKAFTGKSYFSFFIPTGKAVLLNVSEAIDRLNCSYSVVETYKYVTGSTGNFFETFSASISDSSDSTFPTIDTDIRWQGSPYNGNLNDLSTYFANTNILSRLENMGIVTGFLGLTSSSVNQDTGANTLEIKNSYLSGLVIGDITGYLDYVISVETDKTIPKNVWKIEGEFISAGPLDYKLNRLQSFKNSIPNWRTYLSGLIVSSPLYSGMQINGNLLSSNLPLTVQEISGIAQFKISLTMPEGPDRLGSNQKYNVSVQPSKWRFEMLPASNIEGHYVIQDIQMRDRARVTVEVSADSLNPKTLTGIASGILDDLSDIYVTDGFIIGENLETGLSDISYRREWIGMDTQSSGILFTKLVGSTTKNYVRGHGFSFGY